MTCMLAVLFQLARQPRTKPPNFWSAGVLADGRRSECGFVTEYSDFSVPDLDLGDH